LWTIGVVLPSAFVWFAGLVKALETAMRFETPSVLFSAWLFGSVYWVSGLCIWIAPIMAGHKLSRWLLLGIAGMVLMLASCWASCNLCVAILVRLGM
jgi:hypothetical protein